MLHKFKIFQLVLLIAMFVASLDVAAEPEGEHMRIAEWGTFTVLQNDEGEALPGVNVNEERLPNFVHRLGKYIIPDVNRFSPITGPRSKGIPSSYPYAIMRMETPIIYFYPPKSQTEPTNVDLSVGFRGGWISEWYPQANVNAPGFKNQYKNIGTISPDRTGTINWKNIRVGGKVQVPRTDEHVWLAPRDVPSAPVKTTNGESEQYLFYRGVANIQSPLRVLRSCKGALTVETNGRLLETEQEFRFSAMWLADIRSDGKVAFRELPAVTVRGMPDHQVVAGTSSWFSESEFSAKNLDQLHKSMHKALVAEGLTKEESTAMLNTWKLSYFQSPGLRLFFTLPRQWTDSVLPMSVSVPADITRVMIGRIELITPKQRELVDKIAEGPISTTKWFSDGMNRIPANKWASAWQKLYREETTFKELGITDIPADYQAYVDLGRFRDAIILDRLRREPNANLKQFTLNYFVHRFAAAPAKFGKNPGPTAPTIQ